MRSFLKVILISFLPGVTTAQLNSSYLEKQQQQLDSLQLALMNAANDTIQMDLFKKIAFYYLQIKRDSSLYFRQQQLLISQKLKLKLYEADALIYIGYLYRLLGNYPLSLEYLIKALKITEDPSSEKSVWGLSENETPRKARLSLLAANHQHFAELYGATGNIEQRLIHLRLSEKFATESNDKYRLSLIYMGLGLTYYNLNKLDSALAFELTSLKYNNQSFNKRNRGIILNMIGAIYFKKENYKIAKQYFLEAVRESEKQINLASLAGAYVSLANLFAHTEEKDSSLWYAKRGLEMYQSAGSPVGLVDAYLSLSSIYKLRNNVDSAFMYLGMAMAEKDSLYNAEKITQFQNIGFDEQLKIREQEEEKIKFQNKIRTLALLGGLGIFLISAIILYRNNKQKQKANFTLQQQKEEIQSTLSQLKSTQAQLIQSEKMASLGELTAGIAHEIQNPLNFVNNFSEVNAELIDELNKELAIGNTQLAKEIAGNIKDNEEKIIFHGKRAAAIVKGMLQHSRASSSVKEPTDINALADEYLRLAYHGLRAKDKSFNATMKTDFDSSIGLIDIIPQDIGRVLLNLFTNAFYAISEKKKQLGEGYEPVVSVSTTKRNDKILLSVKDNGMGISQKVLDKIFQPFFSTKPTGQGTGLGLSISYDIIKAHGGELKVETKEGELSEFMILLPI